MLGRLLSWGAAILLAAAPARAADTNPYAASYCEPAPDTKLLYTNRAYLILPKTADAPPLYFSYRVLGTDQFVQRRGQLLFDDGSDHWELESDADGLRLLWPLRPQNHFELDRVDRTTGAHAHVAFMVLGLEPIEVQKKIYRSWKIRRLDKIDDGTSFLQFLWYAPELCTLTAFTDSQHRVVKLLRALKPGDTDYERPVIRRQGRLHFADTDELVK
jgi:hypothetical protein